MAETIIPVLGNDAAFVARVEDRLTELIASGFEITRVDIAAPRPK